MRDDKRFREYEPDQSLLLPQNMGDWLPEDHLAFFVKDVVGELDLSPILGDYDNSLGGYPAYDPRMMTALLLMLIARARRVRGRSSGRRGSRCRSGCWPLARIRTTRSSRLRRAGRNVPATR